MKLFECTSIDSIIRIEGFFFNYYFFETYQPRICYPNTKTEAWLKIFLDISHVEM